MKNLNELEKVIREALPELMDLNPGCFFTRQNKTYSILSEFKDASFNQRYIFESRIDGFGYNTSNFRTGSAFHEQISVIGQEIQLIHVLKWLQTIMKKENPYYINVIGEIMTSTNDFCCKWNLDENLLKNQSQELIDFLFNLKVK
jgi:hypothetical protein